MLACHYLVLVSLPCIGVMTGHYLHASVTVHADPALPATNSSTDKVTAQQHSLPDHIACHAISNACLK